MNDDKYKALVVIAFMIFAFCVLFIAFGGMTKSECYKAAQVNHNIKCE